MGAQLFMLNDILATEFSIYGIEVLSHVVKGEDWTEAPHVAFPRVTFCDFKVRRLGNVHRYTVQCLLPINMYTEKIYMFLWFWLVFVAIATVFDWLIWIARYMFFGDKVRFISKHLSIIRTDEDREGKKDQVKKFINKYLKQDGVFLLRLIGQNTSSITVTDITYKLWQLWEDSDSDSSLGDSDPSSDLDKPEQPSAPEKDPDETTSFV